VGVDLAAALIWIPTPDQALSWSEAVWRVEPFSGLVEDSVPPLLPDLIVSLLLPRQMLDASHVPAAAVEAEELLSVKALLTPLDMTPANVSAVNLPWEGQETK
jgi:hypothetical protein